MQQWKVTKCSHLELEYFHFLLLYMTPLHFVVKINTLYFFLLHLYDSCGYFEYKPSKHRLIKHDLLNYKIVHV